MILNSPLYNEEEKEMWRSIKDTLSKPVNALEMTPEEFNTHLEKTRSEGMVQALENRKKFQEQHRYMTKSAWDMTDEEFKQECDRVRGRRLRI